ncbi:MAG TPA: peptide deformylase [Spirochaetota bacterium]|nr:peptide deformylase [Spirochaetota bacterium]HOM37754.1 peptide deformylase [Spirochaetota bacterium]HPQ49369.1 peptide deformylase [Spirochaetota bacterium]
MILEIVKYPAKSLREKSSPVNNIDDIKELASNMYETMLKKDGVGLAAPQVGQNIRLIVINKEYSEDWALVNPEISFIDDEQDVLQEGCLSVPGVYGRVKRYKRVFLKALTIDNKVIEKSVEGFFARILQHEIDHLNGILFIDKVLPIDKKKVNEGLKELKEIKVDV